MLWFMIFMIATYKDFCTVGKGFSIVHVAHCLYVCLGMVQEHADDSL